MKVYEALDALTKFLKGDKSADDTEYVKQVKSHFDDEADQKSFALRLVIHYTGDVHQPLHTVSAVDETYPKGDRGGNDERMPEKEGVNELHALWDSVIYDFAGYPDLVSLLDFLPMKFCKAIRRQILGQLHFDRRRHVHKQYSGRRQALARSIQDVGY